VSHQPIIGMGSGLPANDNAQFYDLDYYCSASTSEGLTYYVFFVIRLGCKALLQSRSAVVVSRIVCISGNITDTEVFQLGSKYVEPNFFFSGV
jgi:hypothetical protein